MNNCGWGYSPHPKRTLIRSLLINGMCLFADGTRAARRREKRASTLGVLYENAWHSVAKPPRNRSGTAFSRFVLLTARLPFVARNELAIATKSIASVLSPATRSPWVPSNLCRGGTAIGKTPEERGNFNLSFDDKKRPSHIVERGVDTVIRSIARFYPKTASKNPAATADPITPATFGPIACIRR